MKNIISFIDSIILENQDKVMENKFSSFDLSELERQDLAALFFQLDDFDFCALSENSERNKIDSLILSVLHENTLDEKIELANTLRDCIVSYYKKSIDNLVAERIATFQCEYMFTAGYKPRRHADNGETYWVQRHA